MIHSITQCADIVALKVDRFLFVILSANEFFSDLSCVVFLRKFLISLIWLLVLRSLVSISSFLRFRFVRTIVDVIRMPSLIVYFGIGGTQVCAPEASFLLLTKFNFSISITRESIFQTKYFL